MTAWTAFSISVLVSVGILLLLVLLWKLRKNADIGDMAEVFVALISLFDN